MNAPPLNMVMSRLGWVACAVGAVAAIVAIRTGWPAITALVAPSSSDDSALEDPKTAKERFTVAMDANVAAVKGRSAFYPPPRRDPPRVDPPPRDDTPRPTPPPPAPSRYGGPGIQAIINGAVWFADGSRVNVGGSTGTGSSAVTVLAADSPYAVKLKWQDKEWEVPLFERDAVIYPAKPDPSKPDPAKTDAAKPDPAATTPPASTSTTTPPSGSPSAPSAVPAASPGSPPASPPASPAAAPGDPKPSDSEPADSTAAPKSTPAASPADKKDEGSPQ